MRRIPVRLVLAVTPFALTAMLAATADAQPRPYAEVIPAGASVERGMFDVHRVGARLLFQIPDSLLGRDMIIMSRYGQVQDGLSQVGANMAPNLVVRWERRDDQLYLRAASHQTTADSGTARSIAVEHQNFAPVLQAFPVAARGDRTSVIDVTELYLGEHPAFTLPKAQRTEFAVRRYERDRSWLEFARSFPTNVELRVVQSFSADQPPSNVRGGALSYEVNHSMILLPARPMMPRLWDERVGFSSVERTNYSSGFQGVRPDRYVRRYRLEPSDTAAFLRGELVEPVKPWIWYIDPATPEKWVPYIEAGILEWNGAFEDAGFRNAIQVRRAPTPREDPTFSLLDARHSVLRYVPTTVRSANSGGDVIDPRSGEVLRAHTNMYEAVAERMRWQLLSQVATAADDRRYRTSRLPDDLMGEAIRYVTSHETAHSVGLPHNQRANFVFPVDSIRNPDFVRRMGHSGSSVGRTRFNYAAQPGDGVPPERRMGVWDRFAVYWGYRPIIGAETPEAETATLHKLITERADKPWFRFASAQFGMDEEWDPYRMTEGISADPVEAASLGMNNLRTMVDSLIPWLLSEGDDYYELETHYLQALTQWNRYAEHAAAAVGGSWTHHKRYGEPGVVYTPVEPEYQRKAMKFIDEQVLATPTWALNVDVLRRLEHAGAVERIRAYQELAVQRLLNHARLARMIEHEAFHGEATYTPTQMLDDARASVWRDARSGGVVDSYRRNLQRAYLAQARHLLTEADNAGWSPPRSGDLRVGSDTDPRLNGDLKIAQSDIRPLIRDQLKLLRGELSATLARGVRDRNTRIHLEDALVRIDATLEP
ncbi:MAG: zinc-dependent metalloprotease [Gemmatimonadaceae bacterium]